MRNLTFMRVSLLVIVLLAWCWCPATGQKLKVLRDGRQTETYALSVLRERFPVATLEVVDPHRIRLNATMPPLPDLPERQAVIDDIVAYLKVMAEHKQRPEGP